MSPGSTSNVLNPLQAYSRRAVHREELSANPTEEVDLPAKVKAASADRHPRRAAALLAVAPAEDRPIWATAFYAGLRRGELQALRCMDVDLNADPIHVRKGRDQVEGEIEPKSTAAKRSIPILAVLHGYLAEQLRRTGRRGKDRLFGCSAGGVFYASTIDGRAMRAWRAHNTAEREAASEAGREPELLTMGHSKIQTTFDLYGHLLPGSYDDVRARMDAYQAAG